MNDALWRTCTDPQMMLESVHGRASSRKFRLFACACVRHHAELADLKPVRRAVRLAELFADGRIGGMKLGRHLSRARWGEGPARDIAQRLLWASGCESAQEVSRACIERLDAGRERAAHAALLRDVVNPTRAAARVPRDWLRWNGGKVPRIARGIYEEGRFHDLPILGDALIDAGCDEEEVLAHCRSGGEHVRGCWVVDLCLGKS